MDFSMTSHEPIMHPAHSPTHTTTTGYAFFNDPLECHWVYPIVEEAPLLIPLQEINRALEHLNFLMDIH